MALTLAVRCADAGELPTITFDLPRIIVGRGESCDLRLPDPSVSQHHASIRQRGSDYIIIDEGSTNGTFVGPVRLAPQAPRVLRSGDSIRVGRIWIDVRIEAAASQMQGPLLTKDLALQLVAQTLKAQGEASIPELRVTQGDNAGTVLMLERLEQRYVLGRSATADLVLCDTNASRRHVEVWRQGARVLLRDLGSKNGSKLDSAYVLPDKPVEWHDGATLNIGTESITLDDPAQRALDEMSHSADDHLTDTEQNELASDSSGVIDKQRPASMANSTSAERPLIITAKTLPRQHASKTGRVTSADLGVVILALVVLGASLVGLLWMLGGK
jgi:pSer/pThr/pTyr-binding forkhead associated (FHA) protein